MDISKIKFGVVLTILAMAIVSSACGPGAEPTPTPTPTPTPSANQPPQISSVTAAQMQVHPSDIIEIQCNAADPDGDTMSYEWSATGGKFTKTGPTVSWIAPDNYGDWDITITVKDGEGGVTQTTITLSVVQNLDPVISNLTANPDTVLPQGKATITCTASDPDSEVLTYRWEATGGEITGSGDMVTWIAPDTEGTYTITAFVDDEQGGGTISTVPVTVKMTDVTQTFTPLADETGTVSSTGDKDTSRTIAGDDEDNIGYRAFWCFDLYSLKGTEVKEAYLTFVTHKIVETPFKQTSSGLRGLYIWQIRSEPGQLPDYSLDPVKELAPLMWEAPEIIDVTEEVNRIGRGLAPSDRLQVRAGFMSKTDGTGDQDFIEWDAVTLTVTYTKK